MYNLLQVTIKVFDMCETTDYSIHYRVWYCPRHCCVFV